MKKIIITLSIFAVLFTSCERVDYGDINQNPISPEGDDIEAMVRGAMIAYGDQGYRAGYDVTSCYAQYQAQTSYTNEQLYSQFPGSWRTNYVSILNTLKRAHDINEYVTPIGNDTRTTNIKATTELFSILVWKRITDTFGDIPYFEALQGGANITPAYTAQKDIYIDLIARAKAARDMIDPSAPTLNADSDIYYGGDMTKWGKFANSMILALTIQLSNTSEAGMAQTEFQAALADAHGLIESNADNLVFTPDNAGNSQNPISHERASDYLLTKEFTDALKGAGSWGPLLSDTKNPTSNTHGDGRIAGYLDSNGDGLPYGFREYPDVYADNAVEMNYNYQAASAPFTLFSAAYTWLNRAEGSLIYATGEDTNTMFGNGIAASYASVVGAVGSAASHTANRLADVAGSVTMAQVIAEEKWIALFPDGHTAWTEQRRTGFPALHAAPEATNGGVVPQRMLYPNGEAALNPSSYTAGLQGLTPAEDKNTSKVWWAQ